MLSSINPKPCLKPQITSLSLGPSVPICKMELGLSIMDFMLLREGACQALVFLPCSQHNAWYVSLDLIIKQKQTVRPSTTYSFNS